MNINIIYKLLSGLFALLISSQAFAYNYTIENYGASPIYFIHARTVSSFCHDRIVDLPPGGLQPGQSVQFSSASICLVDQILVSVVPTPWDFQTPYVVSDGKIQSPPLHPPSFSGWGHASGTWVVGRTGICFHSGFEDFLYKGVSTIFNLIADFTKQNMNGSAFLKGLIELMSPELGVALSFQSAGWSAISNFNNYFNPGYKIQGNPMGIPGFIPVDPSLNFRINDNLRSNVGCGW